MTEERSDRTPAEDWRERLERGEAVRLTVRALLEAFGQPRRGRQAIAIIRDALGREEIETRPEFARAYIDGEIELLLRTSEGPEPRDPTPPARAHEVVPRLAWLPAASRLPACVHAAAPARAAVALLLESGASALPVVDAEGRACGVFGWRSLGETRARGLEPERVSEAMFEARTLPAEAPLAEALEVLRHTEVLLVVNTGARVLGAVRPEDVADQLHEIARPFVLVAQIEVALRALLAPLVTAQEVRDARDPGSSQEPSESVEDLSFGELQRLLTSRRIWPRLGLDYARSALAAALESIRKLRNAIMHFDPDPLEAGDLSLLEEMARQLTEAAAVAGDGVAE